MAYLSLIGFGIIRSLSSLWHTECLSTIASSKPGFKPTNQHAREGSVRMANELRTEVEQVKKDEDVKRALKQTSTVKPDDAPKAETKDKLLLGTHVIVLIALIVFYF